MFDQITRCSGLISQYNPMSTAPGGLAKADNIVIRRENVIEDRRGYKVDGALANNVSQVIPYSGKVLVNNGSLMSYGPSSYLNYAGTYSPPSGLKMRFAEAASNLYVTTNLGIKVFADTSGTQARAAGMPRMLDPSFVLNAAGAGFLAANYQCAYRCTLSRTDANSNVITGYPSSRLWVSNSAATGKNIDLTVYLPAEAAVSDVVSFYRTTQVSGTSSDAAGDECALVYQYTLVASDITNGYVFFTDVTVDALRGAALYTNASQEGITQANDRPPAATDIALFKTFMLYANCQTKQRLFLTLVGSSGLTGNTITLAGVTYNFGATEILSGAGSPQVQVGSTGVAASDIDSTARSLVRVINRYAGNTAVYAYYLSGPTDLPGQIMLEEKGIGAAAYTVQSSNATIQNAFYPPPPVAPATSPKSTSSNQIQKNAVYFSKNGQYEHVPTLNFLPIGASNKNILRIVPLRNSIIVIKEEGVYRITGDAPSNFTATPLDLTVYCKARDSVSSLANQVFMLSNQGAVAISENGVQVISRDIADIFKPLLTNASLASLTYGVSYESEGFYILSTITNPTDTAQNQTLVYCVYTRAWFRWTFGVAAACIDPSQDKLYFATPSSLNVNVERKSFDNSDYADPEFTITINSLSGMTANISVSGTSPQVGWAISQSATALPIQSIIVNPSSFTVTFASPPPASWAPGSATLYPSVGAAWEYLPWTANNPGEMKQVRIAKIFTDAVGSNSTETSLVASFHSNFDDDIEQTTLTQGGSGWGSSWGSMGWGGGGNSYGYPTFVPRKKQYCNRLSLGVSHPNALEKVSCLGVALEFEQVSGSIGR